MSFVFLCAAYILCFLGGLWIIILAWQEGILWGLGCLLIPIVQVFYVALHWKQAKSAFFLQLAGFACFVISGAVGK